MQRIPSSDGLLLAAGGEGRLTDGQGRLILKLQLALTPNQKTLLTDWGRRDPSGAGAAGAAGHVLETLADPRAEPGYDLNHKGMDRPSFNT